MGVAKKGKSGTSKNQKSRRKMKKVYKKADRSLDAKRKRFTKK